MIVAGFGFRKSATQASLADALARAGHDVQAFATAADKASVLQDLAARHDVPIHTISPEVLAAQSTLTASVASIAARDVGSLAEAAALAGAGPGARLLAPRVVSADRLATCALAQAPIQGDTN